MPAGFDAWLTTDPNIEDVSENWEMLRRCICGCWLKLKPDNVEHTERIEKEEQLDGSIEHIDCSYYRLTFHCTRCEHTNYFDEM